MADRRKLESWKFFIMFVFIIFFHILNHLVHRSNGVPPLLIEDSLYKEALLQSLFGQNIRLE